MNDAGERRFGRSPGAAGRWKRTPFVFAAILLAAIPLLLTTTASAVDPAGGFGGGPIAGAITVRVVDEMSGLPLSEAYVQVGSAPSLPFIGNTDRTDSTGSITFISPGLAGPLTVTAGKEGHSYSTIIGVDASTVILPIRPLGVFIERPTYTGEIPSGWNIVWNDNLVDAAVVWHTIPIRDLIPMLDDLTAGRLTRLSPIVVEHFLLIGDADIPGAVYMPFQIELLLYPIERKPYVIYVEDGETTDLWAIYGRIPLTRVLAELTKQQPDLFNLILDFDIRRYGLEEGIVVNGPGSRDFDLTIERGPEVWIPIDEPLPVDVMVAAVADLDGLSGNGRLYPSGFAAVPGESEALLGMPTLGAGAPGDPNYIFALVRNDTLGVLGSGAALLRAGLAPGDTAEAPLFLEFTEVTGTDSGVAWSSMANPEDGIFPDVHEVRISYVISVEDTTAQAEPGDSIDIGEVVWTIQAGGGATGASIPLLGGDAPDPFLDTGLTPESDRYDAAVTGFRLGEAPGGFDYDDWDLKDRDLQGTQFTKNATKGIAIPVSPLTEVAEAGSDGPFRAPLAGFSSPNPFRGETTILFGRGVPATGSKIVIYDVAGRRVRELAAADSRGGSGAVWDGRDDAGRPVPSGVYFARLHAGGREATVRVVLLR